MKVRVGARITWLNKVLMMRKMHSRHDSQHGSNFFLIRDSLFYQNDNLQPVISTEPSPHLYRFALPHPLDCPHSSMG